MNAKASTRRRLRPATPPAPGPELAAALIETREEAGLSQRELATLLGISNSTIASLERGADAQWSTLAGLLRVLPGLAARDLLPNPSGHPPAALAIAWQAHRDLLGFECDLAEVTLRVIPGVSTTSRMHLRRVRLAGARMAEVPDLTNLMRMASRLPARVSIERLEGAQLLSEGRLSIQHEDMRHEFEIVDPATRAFDYGVEDLSPGRVQFEKDAAPRAAASLAVAWPARRVKLTVETNAAGDGATHALAWLPAVMSEPWESELLSFLHPGQKARRNSARITRRAELHVEWPPIGVTYALGIAAGVKPSRSRAQRTRPGSPATFADVARRLADVRIRHDLSLRQLAREMSVAASTILAVESGHGGRASLLAAYLRRFPELAPQDLLPPPGTDPGLGRSGLWRYDVRLFGVVTDQITKMRRMRPDGHVQFSLMTEGLRVMGRVGEPVRLRTMVQRLLSEGEVLPPAVTCADSRVRQRLVHHEGEATWEFVFPRDLAEKGASYRRTYPWKPGSVPRAPDAVTRESREPQVSITTYPTPHPLKRLTLDVRFPPGYWPEPIGIAAWPLSLPPIPDEAALRADLLDRFLHEWIEDRRAGRIILRVRRPIPGVRFAVWWTLPD